MPESISTVKAEGSRARRPGQSAVEPSFSGPEAAPVLLPAAVARAAGAPPEDAAQRYRAALRRLPSTALQRQFVAAIGRQHGNAFLQRAFAPSDEQAGEGDDGRPLGTIHDASPRPAGRRLDRSIAARDGDDDKAGDKPPAPTPSASLPGGGPTNASGPQPAGPPAPSAPSPAPPLSSGGGTGSPNPSTSPVPSGPSAANDGGGTGGMTDPHGASAVGSVPGDRSTPASVPPPAKQPTVADPSSGVDWGQVFTPITDVRIGAEFFRFAPVVGLATGAISDVLGGWSDLQQVKDEDAPYFKAFTVVRDFLNLINNGIAHVMYVVQLVQDAAAGSVIGSILVPFTALANEIGSGGKALLDGGLSLVDIVGMAWAQDRQMNAPPGSPSAANWKATAANYGANVLGDWANFGLDVIDIASAGAGQGGAIEEAVQVAKTTAPVLKLLWTRIVSLISGWWNVLGGSALSPPQKAASPAPAPAARLIARQPAGGAGAKGLARAAAYQVVLTELRQIKTGYVAGDAVLGFLVKSFTQQKDVMLQAATKLSGGKDPFVMFRDGANKMLGSMRDRVERLGSLRAIATTSGEKATAIVGTCDAFLGKIDAFVFPNVQLPKPKLGDGAVAQVAEGLLSKGTDLANAGLEALLGKIRGATDEAKGMLREPVTSVRSHGQDIAQFLQIVTQMAGDQITFVNGWIAGVSAKLAKCQNAEQVIELAINKVTGMVGLDTNFKFDDLRKAWGDLGPMIDQATTWAEQQRAAALAPGKDESADAPAPAPAPPPDPGGQSP